MQRGWPLSVHGMAGHSDHHGVESGPTASGCDAEKAVIQMVAELRPLRTLIAAVQYVTSDLPKMLS